MTERRVGAYVGVDPTAPSLHVGHMIPFMALAWMYIYGYSAHFLLGGATAAVGDPTDRTTEREEMTGAVRKANMTNMHMQLKKLGIHIEKSAERYGYNYEWAWTRALHNNASWWNKTSALEVLKTLGREIRLGPLLGRDSVKTRMDTKEGMSLAEFFYPLMQAWDWWYLYQRGVQIQIGGADQFGNILAGADAVSRMAKAQGIDCTSDIERFNPALGTKDRIGRHMKQLAKDKPEAITTAPIGFTVPLLTNSANEKFGKSMGNAIWIDPEMTKSFDLYQFFLRSSDADVERYLKLFTFLSIPKIREVLVEHEKDPSKRKAQHLLAYEFVWLAHGNSAADEAEKQHRQLFGRNVSFQGLLEQTRQASEGEEVSEPPGNGGQGREDWNPSLNKYAQPTRMDSNQPTRIKLPRSLVVNQYMNRVLWSAGLVGSKSEGHRLLTNQGCYVGAQPHRTSKDPMGEALEFSPLTNFTAEDTAKYIIDDSLLILRVGKWKMRIITLVPDEEYEKLGLSCPGWKDEVGEGQAQAELLQEKLDYRHERTERRRSEKSEGREWRGRDKSETRRW
ncbi:MAG: hypothetical protein Q9160_004411 [Pyrenula sp. 1 TL-2023]